MIVVVDDEEVTVEVSQAALEEAGFAVKGFTSPSEALLFLKQEMPELVVSDLMMPGMDGFAFRDAYMRNFPERSTPFLFLSSIADPDIIVAGLEQGAADYLIKPLDHRVLTAKIRSILKRTTDPVNVFHGDLAHFPLNRIMKFCELKGITGTIDIVGDGVATTLACRGGTVDQGGQNDGNQFEKAFDLTSGSFTIRTNPVDFADLRTVQTSSSYLVSDLPPQALPMGKLSGVKVNNRTFQVQSEFVEKPTQQIITMVILDGKVVLKRGTPAPISLGRETLQQLIEEQHSAVEREVREKISSRIESKNAEGTTHKERFNALFEEGWESYCKGDYATALTLWENAQEINPSDKTIETNLKIVRNKLASLA
jgi:CheY-like chemotaxis protein